MPVCSTCSDHPAAVSASLQDYGGDYGAYEDSIPGPLNCSTAEAIKGGHVTYSQVTPLEIRVLNATAHRERQEIQYVIERSRLLGKLIKQRISLREIFQLLNLASKVNMLPVQGGLEGSVLSYHCGPGQYPDPLSSRLCGPDGDWSPMRSASGRRVSQATCRGDVPPATDSCVHQPCRPIRTLFPPTPFRHFVSSSTPAGSRRYLAQESVVSGRCHAELLLPGRVHSAWVSPAELHRHWGLDGIPPHL